MEILRVVLVGVIKILISGVLSVVFYLWVISYLHVAVYAYRLGVVRSDLWAGDGFGLLIESIPIILFGWIFFYWLFGFIFKKFRRNKK